MRTTDIVRGKVLHRFHSYINAVARYSFPRVSAVGMSVTVKWTDCYGCFAATEHEPVNKAGGGTGNGDNNAGVDV